MMKTGEEIKMDEIKIFGLYGTEEVSVEDPG